jgi:hypothetical protein
LPLSKIKVEFTLIPLPATAWLNVQARAIQQFKSQQQVGRLALAAGENPVPAITVAPQVQFRPLQAKLCHHSALAQAGKQIWLQQQLPHPQAGVIAGPRQHLRGSEGQTSRCEALETT